MLTCPTNEPNTAIASYVDSFLQDAPWLRRRVETIRFLDIDTVVRSTTIDIDIAKLESAFSACPFFPDRPLVPIAMMRKDLLVNFSLRDREGSALSVMPREIDSYLAHCLLCDRACKVLDLESVALPSELQARLKEIIFSFPDPNDTIYSNTLMSWQVPQNWSAKTRGMWDMLERDTDFSRLLREFTFNFILITQLDLSNPLQLIKFSYQQHLPYSYLSLAEKLGMRPAEIDIAVPTVGWARSYHVRIEAPDEIVLTDIVLARIERGTDATPRSAESYEARINAGFAQVYTTSGTSTKPAEHAIGVTMRTPVVGYLRAVWLTTMAIAVMLGLAWWHVCMAGSSLSDQASATVTLLLVAPSLLAAYLVRPGEHAITSRLLRSVRYVTAFSGGLSYIGAALIVFAWTGSGRLMAWWVITVSAIIVALFLTTVVYLTRRDILRAQRSRDRAYSRFIAVLPYSSGE